MPAVGGYRAFRLMEKSELHLFETRPLLGHALNIALHNQMSLWDCVYLALAARNCAFVVADHLFRGHSARTGDTDSRFESFNHTGTVRILPSPGDAPSARRRKRIRQAVGELVPRMACTSITAIFPPCSYDVARHPAWKQILTAMFA
jgi:hypothetical protein